MVPFRLGPAVPGLALAARRRAAAGTVRTGTQSRVQVRVQNVASCSSRRVRRGLSAVPLAG